ncbi:hypothetical protein [Amycolatopsis anabasis]|uniref:hypothetical protein n=1 Tax=Amycolatopsis anabasis TaxID=1840409 RepID=UPI00131A6E7F|nr:hypothetical protein [Amycolatopsis anabasis]
MSSTVLVTGAARQFAAASGLDCDRAVESIMDEQGRLDVVVHNAGHLTLLGPYVATKGAFDALAQAVKYEVARFGIDVVTDGMARLTPPKAHPRAMAEEVNAAAERAKADLMRRIGIDDLRQPYTVAK